VGEPEVVEVSHRFRERPDAWDHERVGGSDLFVVVRDRRGGADVLERLLDRAAIAHPVVDHADTGAHTSVPFVLGTPRSVGSSATAALSARAKDLKVASIT